MAIFTSTRDSELEKALLSLSKTVLESVCREAIRGEAFDSCRFQESMRSLCDQMENVRDPDHAYDIAKETDKALKEYHEHTTKHFEGVSRELLSVIATLFSTVSEVHNFSKETATRFKMLEKQLQKAEDVRSLRDCRLQITQGLTAIREKADPKLSIPNSNVDPVPNPILLRSDQTTDDAVCGLQSRFQAEETILAHSQSCLADVYVVVFVVHRVNLINAKYGQSIGDSILRCFLRHLMTSLPNVDELYRWSGPAFLAVIHRPEGLVSLRREIIRITAQRLEETYIVNNREVLLPVGASGMAFETKGALSAADLINKMDQFVKTAG